MTGVAAASRALVAATGPGSSTQPGGIEGWLLHFHGPTAYALVGFLAFAEAALMVGFFIPGETAVVIGGVLAGLQRVDLGIIMAVVVVCAIAGDSVGFEVGKRSGPWLLERRPLRGNAAVRRTMAMLEHYGGPAVFFGRFVAFARAIIPGLAGMSGLRYRVFLFFNAMGGLVWGIGYVLLGYIVGLSFQRILTQVGKWSIVVVATVVAAAIGVRLLLKRRERRRLAVELEGGDGGAEEPRLRDDRRVRDDARAAGADPPAGAQGPAG